MEAVDLAVSDAQMVWRVTVAVLLGGAIGLEREITGQPAGFRTHVLVALGSMLFGLISVHAFDPYVASQRASNVTIDVSRIASYVAAGIGFLGAGAILKQGGSIRGLTTAASLWVTAAVGLSVGLGYFGAAVAVTVAALVSLAGLRGVRTFVRRRLARDYERVQIRLVEGARPGDVVSALNQLDKVTVRQLQIETDEESGSPVIQAQVEGVAAEDLEGLLAPLAEREDVEELYLNRSS